MFRELFTAIFVVFLTQADSADIATVWELNAAIANGANNKVGFLTQANYNSVKSLLHSSVTPKIIDHLAPLEEAVLNGSIIAGVTSTRPVDCEENIMCFPSGLVTTRGIMFAPGVSQKRRNLINRALVTFLTNGSATSIENYYAEAHGMEVVNVNDCPWDTSVWNISGLSSDDYNFRVACLEANWGYQGNYLLDDPTGFWPELYNGIEASIGANFTRLYYSGSNDVMAAIESDEADITEPYWTIGGIYKDQPRVELFKKSCTVLGTDSVFFTKKTMAISTSSGVADWVVILLSIGGGLAFIICVGLACFSCHIIRKEKEGNPLFMQLGNQDPTTDLVTGGL